MGNQLHVHPSKYQSNHLTRIGIVNLAADRFPHVFIDITKVCASNTERPHGREDKNTTDNE